MAQVINSPGCSSTEPGLHPQHTPTQKLEVICNPVPGGPMPSYDLRGHQDTSGAQTYIKTKQPPAFKILKPERRQE